MNYTRIKGFVAGALILAGGNMAFAQERHITIQPAGGVAVSYIQTKNTEVKFSPRILPHFGVSVLIPVEGRFSVRTGIGYEQKGWRAYSAYTDTALFTTSNEFISTIKLHAIVIPLHLCYTTGREKPLQYTVSGGMNYSFFAKAEEKTVINTYHRERFVQTQTLFWNPYIALIPDDSRLKKTYDGTAYYLFSAAFRAEAGVSLRKRYALQAFWEYTLTDISAVPGNAAPLHLGYCGLSLGINL